MLLNGSLGLKYCRTFCVIAAAQVIVVVYLYTLKHYFLTAFMLVDSMIGVNLSIFGFVCMSFYKL